MRCSDGRRDNAADPEGLRGSGGVRPSLQRRRANHLTAAEREEISRGIAAGLSARQIAQKLASPVSTVSREIARNGGRQGYRAVDADTAAYARARRPKACKLVTNPVLRAQVVAKLVEDWSPEQIARWLRRAYPSDSARWVSHETIYRDVYTPSRNVFDAKIFHHLRTRRPIRQPRRARPRCAHGRGRIRSMVSIRERPVEADTRQVAGHWEGDLVFGLRPSAVATLVDRDTRYTIVVALPDGHKADAVAVALIKHMAHLPVTCGDR